ncbi:MAG: hypothetical protein JWL97_3581 [Gemmatimonadales bacterium]|jgi:hypothetical protein|nr:hypothetical protein [Streptosporangiaceae bacterium]MDB4872577.1 hypothetical protein [Gemmatimonadales bacterium]
MNEHEMRRGGRVTALPQTWVGKVHFFPFEPPSWPLRVHCGEYLVKEEADRVTDDLSCVAKERRCRKCWGRKETSDRSKLRAIAHLVDTAGESGMVSVEDLARIISMRPVERQEAEAQPQAAASPISGTPNTSSK